MSWNKRRWACLLLALMTALPGAWAEEAAQAEAGEGSAAAQAIDAPAASNPTSPPVADTPVPATQAPAEIPAPVEETPVPTAESPVPVEETPAPTAESPVPVEETPAPTEETPAPTAEAPGSTVPASSVAPEPPASEPPAERPEPTAGPSTEPSIEGSTDPSAEPSIEPSAEPSMDPDATPAPSGALNLIAEDAHPNDEGVWQFALTPELREISFSWSAVEGALSYACEVLDGQGGTVYSVQTAECRLSLPASSYAAPRYTLRVRAMAEEAILAEDSLAFALAQSGFPGGGRPSGGGFGGGRPSSGASGGAPEAEQGFHVTPGEALASSHASGTKDMQLYGTVALAPAEAPVTRLTLGGVALSVDLDGGASAFTAALEDETLVLTPVSGGATWTVNARALEILNRSGATALALRLGGDLVTLPTDLEFQGAAYAALRAQGYVSGDFNLRVDDGGLRVEIDGQSFLINDNGELIAP